MKREVKSILRNSGTTHSTTKSASNSGTTLSPTKSASSSKHKCKIPSTRDAQYYHEATTSPTKMMMSSNSWKQELQEEVNQLSEDVNEWLSPKSKSKSPAQAQAQAKSIINQPPLSKINIGDQRLIRPSPQQELPTKKQVFSSKSTESIDKDNDNKKITTSTSKGGSSGWRHKLVQHDELIQLLADFKEEMRMEMGIHDSINSKEGGVEEMRDDDDFSHNKEKSSIDMLHHSTDEGREDVARRQQRNFSPFEIDKKKDDEGGDDKEAAAQTTMMKIHHPHELPEDIYAFIICSGFGTKPWFLGIIVITLQFLVFSLFLTNITDYGSSNEYEIPANVETSVRIVQICCILITTFLQDDLRTAMELLVYWLDSDFQLYVPAKRKRQEDKKSLILKHNKNILEEGNQLVRDVVLGDAGGGDVTGKMEEESNRNKFNILEAAAALQHQQHEESEEEKMILVESHTGSRRCYYVCSSWFRSVVLRGSQGALSLFVSFILIVQSDNVFDLLLNFTAVIFISELDEVAFALAKGGYFGDVIDNEAEFVRDTRYTYGPPDGSEIETLRRNKRTHAIILFLVLSSFYVTYTYGTYHQVANMAYYTCEKGGVHAEFDDGTDPILGTYTGFFDLYGMDDNGYAVYKNDVAALGYCQNDLFWTLYQNENDNPCTYLSKSSETKSFDIMEIEDSTWFDRNGIPLERAQFSCTNLDASCVAAQTDKISSGQDLCKELIIAEDGRFSFEISPTFIMLEGSEGRSIRVHNHPVYWSQRDENSQNTSVDLVIFTGRRWVVIDRSKLSSHPLIKNAKDVTALSAGLELEELHGSRLPKDSVAYISVAVDFSSESCTPIGLSWYAAIYRGEADFAVRDVTELLGVSFTCSICNNVTNPCNFGGVCHEDGCVCNYRTAGSLCQALPIGDGICDEFFNTLEFGYDGGDCCGATCNSPSCGLETLNFAFGSNLTTENGNGFPHCKDPAMNQLTIVAEPFERFGAKYDGVWSARLQLDCDGKNQLFLPLGNEFEQEANETIMVRDGAECVLHVTSQDIRSSTIVRIVDSSGVVLAEVVPDVAERKSVLFLALSPCARDALVNSTIPSRESDEFKSLRWMSNNMIENFRCGDPLLYQRYFLAFLNYATGNALQQNRGWLKPGPHCNEWTGVACNRDSSVVRLDIGDAGLSGTIPSEMGTFTDMREFLSGGNNKLHGTIPSELGLTALETLDLGATNGTLTGSIPVELFELENLRVLWLFGNALTGTIDSSIGLLSNINVLWIHKNQISNSIPTEIGMMSDLANIRLDENKLIGSIPSQVDIMTNLDFFSVRDNDLTGRIPSFGNITNLSEIYLDSNHFNGTLPSTTIGSWTNLNYLWLDDNEIEGTIPSELGLLTSLSELRMQRDMFSGTIPSNLGLLTNLQSLRMESNNLTGKIPSEIGLLTNLSTFWVLGANQISGPLPNEVKILCETTTIDCGFLLSLAYR